MRGKITLMVVFVLLTVAAVMALGVDVALRQP